MNTWILPAALLICAAAAGFCAMFLISLERFFVSHAIKTTARVTALSPLGDHGQLVPILSFVDAEGKNAQKRAQRVGALDVEIGEKVNILYTRKKVFGLDSWNIFVVKNSKSRPYHLYTIMSIVFGAIAVGLAVADILVWIYG